MDISEIKTKPSGADVKDIRESLLAVAKQAWANHPGDDAHSARVGFVQGYMRGEFSFELMLWLHGTHMNEAIKKLLMRVVPEKRPSQQTPFSWKPAPQQQDDHRPTISDSEPALFPSVGGQAQQARNNAEPIPGPRAAPLPLTRADHRRQARGKFFERYVNLYLFKTLDGKTFHDCTAGELLKDAEQRKSPENIARVTRQERRIALFERNLALNLTSNTLVGAYYEKREDLVADAFNRAEQIHVE